MGVSLSLYIPELLRTPPTDAMRAILDREDASDEVRESFDTNAIETVVFIAGVAARRHYGEADGDAILENTLFQVAATDEERELLSDRIQYFRTICPAGIGKGEEASRLVYIASNGMLNIDPADPDTDPFLKMEVLPWVLFVSKTFGDFFQKTPLKR